MYDVYCVLTHMIYNKITKVLRPTSSEFAAIIKFEVSFKTILRTEDFFVYKIF